MKRYYLQFILFLCLLNPLSAQEQGMTLSVYDMAFWSLKDPLRMFAQPAYNEVVPTAAFPTGTDPFWGEKPTYQKWARILPLLTGAGCPTPPGNPDPIPDMCTSSLKGYFTAPASGEYVFTLQAEGDKATLFLGDQDENWQQAKPIASLDGSSPIGQRIDANKYKSLPITLNAGATYPIYAVCWFIHGMGYEIHVSGPGIEGNPIIPASMLKPSANGAGEIAETAPVIRKVTEPLYIRVGSESLCRFDGLGINGDVMSGRMFRDSAYMQRITDLHPGLLRWGALEANLYAFHKAFGPDSHQALLSSGDVAQSHARNMDFCNRIGAAYSLCVGMKDGPGGYGQGDGKDYTVDYVYNPQTFLNLLEYLAGPASSAYGSIRAAEGLSDPVLSRTTGKQLIIELGNESWGANAHNAPMGKDYRKYGEWCRQISRLLKTSPYWPEIGDKVMLAYSGRNVRDQDSYGLNETLLSDDHGELETVAYSGYLGGNMDYDPQVSYGDNVQQYYRERVSQMIANLQEMHQKQQSPNAKKTYFYETQVSTPVYFGNLGQAIILMDYLTSSLRYGSIYPSVFSLGGGEWRVTLDDGTPLSHYALMQLVNTHCRGWVLPTDAAIDSPVGCSAFRGDDGKLRVLLFSRQFDADYPVLLDLPGQGKKMRVSVTTLSGPTPSTRLDYKLHTRTITLRKGKSVVVPAFSAIMLEFET